MLPGELRSLVNKQVLRQGGNCVKSGEWRFTLDTRLQTSTFTFSYMYVYMCVLCILYVCMYSQKQIVTSVTILTALLMGHVKRVQQASNHQNALKVQSGVDTLVSL